MNRRPGETLDELRTVMTAHASADGLSRRAEGALREGPLLLRSAVTLLPANDRTRYALEWAADMECTPAGRERRRLQAGLLWSALRMRTAASRP